MRESSNCSSLVLLLLLTNPGLGEQAKDADQAVKLFESAIERIRSFDVTVTANMRIPVGLDESGSKLRKLRSGEEPRTRTEYSRHIYSQGRGRTELLDGLGGKPIQVDTYDKLHSITMEGGDYRDTFRTAFGGYWLGNLVERFRERKGYVTVEEPTGDVTSPYARSQAGAP